MRTSRVIAALAVVFLGSATFAQDYGIDFVTVGAAGNAAFTQQSPNFPNSEVIGRGAVNYHYRIGRYEITTAQWMAFVNTFNGTTRENAPPFFDWGGPFAWGAVSDPNYSGPGFRYTLPASNPNAAMQPVYGIGWRE